MFVAAGSIGSEQWGTNGGLGRATPDGDKLYRSGDGIGSEGQRSRIGRKLRAFVVDRRKSLGKPRFTPMPKSWLRGKWSTTLPTDPTQAASGFSGGTYLHRLYISVAYVRGGSTS